MKEKILKYIMEKIYKYNPNYSKEKMEEIEYGLEGIYLTFTKLIIIFLIAIILGITKEMIILMIIYNIFRTFVFGLHATKSIYCLISSIILFIGGTYLCIYLNVTVYLKIIISIISVILIGFYSPADTIKRPLIKKKKRIRLKIISILLGIINVILIVIYKNDNISNYLLIGMLEATILILPITYKIFKLPYNNYKTYNSGLINN